MSSGATSSAGRGKNDGGRYWELLGRRGGYGSGLGCNRKTLTKMDLLLIKQKQTGYDEYPQAAISGGDDIQSLGPRNPQRLLIIQYYFAMNDLSHTIN